MEVAAQDAADASPDTGSEALPRSAPGPRYSGIDGELRVATPRIPDAEVTVDGDLDEPVWGEAAVLTGFSQYEPVEGIPATQQTEILVFVTDAAIHFGIRALDDRPGGVRAVLNERDDVDSSDWVRIVLDTYHDRRRAYVFTVNPLGVQRDGIWDEGSEGRRGPPIDDNPDFLWESHGRVTDEGWIAEVQIPFKSLRFAGRPTQSWGIQVDRRIDRNGFEESWAPITADAPNRLALAGSLDELRDLDPGLFLEVNPVLTGRWTGEREDEGGGAFVRSDPEPDFGVNVTYGLTPNLTLDATYNPDFSQVEADAGQIAVNERFALFFPEKRPFFLEGTEVFSLPERLVFTRTITDPAAGWKVTGKVGRFDVGYLGAVDEQPEGGQALVNLARVRMDVGGSSSTVGALYTDRTAGGGDYNRVAATDARLIFADRYTLTLLGAASRTASPGQEAFGGTLLNAELERAGRTFSWSADLEDVGPDFRTRSGFIRRTGDARPSGRVEWSRFGSSGDLLEELGLDLDVRGAWDHDDFWAGRGWKEWDAELGVNLSFRGNAFFGLEGVRSSFRYEPSDYEGLFVEEPEGGLTPFRPDGDLFRGLYGIRLFSFFRPWAWLDGRANLEWGRAPLFERRSELPVERAELWEADVSLTLRPAASLRTALGVSHQTLLRDDGSSYSSATIPRVEVQYQFTRALLARTIVEYGAQEREPLLDPETRRRLARCDDEGCATLEGADAFDFHVEGLISYEPSPGTIVFVGYTRDMTDQGAFRFRDVEPRADGFFAKVSYLFRF